jgi:hypothetical protein
MNSPNVSKEEFLEAVERGVTEAVSQWLPDLSNDANTHSDVLLISIQEGVENAFRRWLPEQETINFDRIILNGVQNAVSNKLPNVHKEQILMAIENALIP